MSEVRYIDAITEEGFALAECLSADEVDHWRGELDAAAVHTTDVDSVRDRGAVYAIRNVFDVLPSLRSLATHPRLRCLVEPILGAGAFLVKGMLFDKSPEANWGVFWHQDLSVPVRLPPVTGKPRRIEVPGFGPWTHKGGIPSVQPPVPVLERMLAVRVHLDPCTPHNGPLRVLPGSHRHARLSDADTQAWSSNHAPVECLCDAGAALVMRPLLLHSSPKCTSPARRRVLHFEFAAENLPSPLEWHERLPIHPESRAA